MKLSNVSSHSSQDVGLLSSQLFQDIQSDSGTHPRLRLTELAQSRQSLEEQNGADVVAGLSRYPKSLPPKYFYDDRGSQLFEQITTLPEYYLTRAETAILKERADEIAPLTGPCELVELGSGSSTKTRYLLDAYAAQGHALRYVPIDVSGGILQDSAHQLLADYPTLQIQGLVGTYEQAMGHLAPTDLPARMICFLGSTLGNLSPTESKNFFQHVTAALSPGDYFLLGVDLQKDKRTLEAAYNDQQGITAAFNLNMLAHLNQKFGGDFDLEQFQHLAFYSDIHHQIEIYLKSQKAQTVRLNQLDLTLSFEAGELLMTEISRKFNLQELADFLSPFGLHDLKRLTDAEQRFGLVLYQYQ
ncbi:MAG: L-histidine N(alpha)-methyltransferase [Cyanobacteria bacterium P01_D01_bin.56]